ncbi:MAG: hypothetical protein ACP6IS_03465 [Candidatus Asgardarchaeia archaeon]
MIYAIWLINRSGTPIIARTYRGFNVDSVLFSGLITAILSFAKEISGHEINEISMGNFKILVNSFIEGPILVMAVSSGDEKTKYVEFVETFRKRIIRRYGLFEEPNIKALPIIIRDVDSLVSSYGFLVKEEFSSEKVIFDSRVQKILSYLLANEKERLTPFAYVLPPRVTFPDMESLSINMDANNLIILLNELSKIGYLSKKVSFSIPACPECGSTALVINATCPECGSTSVTKLEFIEHFKCGYIGPASLFKQGDKDTLICPSCKSVLNVADYRKFESYYCESCGSMIKEPSFKAYCHVCNKFYDFSEVKIKTYYSYTLRDEMKDKIEEAVLKSIIVPKASTKIRKVSSQYRQRFMFFKRLAEHRKALRSAGIPYMTSATIKNVTRRRIIL